MKLIHYLFLGILCMACTSKNSYVVEGKLPADAGVDEVLLIADNGTSRDTLNRCPVGTDGTLRLKGETVGHLLRLDVGKRYGKIYFYPEPGKYRLEQTGGVLYILAEQPGTQSRLMFGLKTIFDNQDSIAVLQEKLYNDTYTGDKEILQERNKELLKYANDLVINIIEEFKDSEIALNFVYDNLYGLSFDFKFLERAVKAMGNVPDSPMREAIMKKYAEKKQELLTGIAPDFKLPDTKGKIISSANYKGKYLLLDFWASWCMPCREKIKDLKKEYIRLQEWGVEVVSISCDKNKGAWLKAIEEDQPTWVQLIEDKKINGSDIRTDYQVQTIPRLFLISPDGIVLDVNPEIQDIKRILGK